MPGRREVTIIGGGSSGMVAAISAARSGAEVVLLERMNRIGRKLLATGNGRCNLTNANCQLSHFHGGNRAVVASVLDQFPVRDTLVFFEHLGIACRTEEDGKVYPRSDQASAVLDVLRYELEQLNVTVLVDADVAAIRAKGNAFASSCRTAGRSAPREWCSPAEAVPARSSGATGPATAWRRSSAIVDRTASRYRVPAPRCGLSCRA